jgi:Zn-dependent peptidase ImmA (M78 family)
MNDSIQKAIHKAKEVSSQYNPATEIPFPFQVILNKHDDIELFGTKHAGISGVIFFDDKENRFKILVNSSEPKERQYFTTAHELGHYFLHKDAIKNSASKGFVDTIDGFDSALFRAPPKTPEDRLREQEANNFAAELLMPEDKVKEVWNATNGRMAVEYYADFFAVSVSAMAIRMDRMGLRKYGR